LRKLEELKTLIADFQIKQFGPAHHFMAEENPQRVVEAVAGLKLAVVS
jgi:hypothetical protein